jgi:hypothetical protein
MKITSHPRFWLISGLLVADTLVFCLTNPDRVPSFMLAVGFLLVAVTFYQLTLGILKAAGWYGLPGGAHRRLARTFTGVLSGVIALQSIGELGPRDVLVLLPLALIAYLYMSYGKDKAVARVPSSDV